jgi:16S rRNA (cytosine1402-N4)-methyltransferase
MSHITVLLEEAVAGLSLSPTDTVVDATFGGGGHARKITQLLGKKGCYIGIDADATALKDQTFPEATCAIHLVHDNFKNISNITRSLHIEHIDAILADLGWRMDQFTNGGKGFSFMKDEPLAMTYGDPEAYDFTVYDIVNDWEESSIADVIFAYGEERASRRIAKAIIEARKKTPIKTTLQLADIIKEALPKSAQYKKVHPATKTFQALRITVNDELGVLEQFLKDSFTLLSDGGRLAVITFHSLEDRMVKQYFKTLKDAGMAELLTKKPISPSPEELAKNPRARSAKLRIITKYNTVEQYEAHSHSSDSYPYQ